jgi:DNA-binding GntR family transcriptional regulator
LSSPQAGRQVDGRTNRALREDSLLESVRRLILDDIIQGALSPGSMIRLSDLTAKYHVSRTPVREALNLLSHEGLVTPIAYKGYLVRIIEPRDVYDIYFMRRVLEGAAAELAAAQITEGELARLQELRPPQVTSMTLGYDEYAHEFHEVIVTAAGSPRLTDVFESVYNNVQRLQYAGIGNPRPDLIGHEHDLIVEALVDRDGSAARRLMEEHLDAVRTRALEQWILGPNRAPRSDYVPNPQASAD